MGRTSSNIPPSTTQELEDKSDSDSILHMESLSILWPENPNFRKSRRNDDDVEPSDDEMDTSEGPTIDRNVLKVVDASHGSKYSKKKKISAAIFQYFMHAAETKQSKAARHGYHRWSKTSSGNLAANYRFSQIGQCWWCTSPQLESNCCEVDHATIGTVQLGMAMQSYGSIVCSARLHLLDHSPLHLEHSRAGKHWIVSFTGVWHDVQGGVNCQKDQVSAFWQT